jgi:hypothetical protein
VKRRLFNLSSGLSLALCVIALLGLPYGTDGAGYGSTTIDLGESKGLPPEQAAFIYAKGYAVKFDFLGFRYYQGACFETGGGRPDRHWIEREFEFPALLIPAFFWILPAIWIGFLPREMRRRRANRRMIAGFCGNCGYDLRASRARCPECGVMPNHHK